MDVEVRNQKSEVKSEVTAGGANLGDSHSSRGDNELIGAKVPAVNGNLL
jgi:hypothetical protein